MIKKLLIILIINVISSSLSYGNWIDDIIKCYDHPCNCGGVDDRQEIWNTVPMSKGPENLLCAPWNKTGGRDNNTCIAGTDYPGNFIFAKVSICIEKMVESTFFNPIVRVRQQSCDAAACWGKNTSLKWDGECVLWPGVYGVPMLRVCARLAMPEQFKLNSDPNKAPEVIPADPGYTVGKHMDFQGQEQDDEPFYDSKGKPIMVNQPKVCVYRDPSLLDFILRSYMEYGPDLIDWNPLTQPLHHIPGQIHPIAKVLIFLLDQAVNLEDALTSLISSLFGDTNGSTDTSYRPQDNFIQVVIKAVGKLIELFPKTMESIIREFGQFNRVVIENYGCVELPIGPFPPAFCDKLCKPLTTAIIQPICSSDGDGNIIKSNLKNKCVSPDKSNNIVNNIINNSVRISYDNIVPICKDSTQALTDRCVNITGDFTARGWHVFSGGNDFIHKCSASVTNYCVSTTADEPAEGFRIVYGLKTGGTVSPSNFFLDEDFGFQSTTDSTGKLVPCVPCKPCDNKIDPTCPVIDPCDPHKCQTVGVPMPDCAYTSATTCQTVYGINTGSFKDITLKFPDPETVSNAAVPLTASESLTDTDGNIRNITVTIARQEYKDPQTGMIMMPNQICAVEGSKAIGCVPRTLSIKPLVIDCTASAGRCINDFYSPKFILALKVGSYQTSIVTPVKNYKDQDTNPNPGPNNNADQVVNLAGFDFRGFATDSEYNTRPFTGINSYNSSSIYGNYMDKDGNSQVAPYDSNLSPINPAPTYIGGLEYFNNTYVRGGEQVCAEQLQADKCPINSSLCVLTSLLDADILDCKDFNDLQQQTYPNLNLCDPKSTKTCTLKVTLPRKSGTAGAGISIYSCDEAGGASSFCYTSPTKKPICRISNIYTDRIDPSAGTYKATIPDGIAYDIDKKPNYDPSINAVRDKTANELALCTPIPQPTCAEITNGGADDGYADWPSTTVGKIAKGTCLAGYKQIDPNTPLERYCLSTSDYDVQFAKLSPQVGCTNNLSILNIVSSDFPKIYEVNRSGDDKQGNLTIVSGSDDEVGTNTYNLVANFSPTDITKIDSLIFKLHFTSYVLIKVNSQVVYSLPAGIDDIALAPSSTAGPLVDTTVDLLPHIKNGDNLIQVFYKTIGKGTLNAELDFQIKN